MTVAQAARLFGVPPDVCGQVLEALGRDGTLQCGHDRRYGLYLQ